MMSTSRLNRLWRQLRAAAVLAAPLIIAGVAVASADPYDSLPPYTYPNETAQQMNPYDPVPEIDPRWCRFGYCPRPPEHSEHRPPPPRALPGILGHDTFLVDCGKASHLPYEGHDERGERRVHHGGKPNMDHMRGVFASINEAAEVAPPNSTILVLPPGQGTTCVESVHVHGPLTIATYGGTGQAVIQAPPGQPCLVAHIPLGDALVVDGIRFIARSRETPCVTVEAGRVTMRNSAVDSRGTEWAFDVHESGELAIESSHIETDASAIHARRGSVTLRDVDIDIDGRNIAAKLNLGRTDCLDRDGGTIHGSVGLALECSEGSVEGGSIIGGAVGILASAGTRGLRLTDVKLTKPEVGILLLPGQLGMVTVEKAVIAKPRDGIVVAPGAESQITGAIITDSRGAGITAYGTDTLISGNKIISAGDGVRILASQAFPPTNFPEFAANAVIDGDDGGPVVENNLIANVRHAGVRVDARGAGEGQHRLDGKLMGNTIYARQPAVCIDDAYNDDPVRVRANTCNREWLPWPF